jgi:hypothetical protein
MLRQKTCLALLLGMCCGNVGAILASDCSVTSVGKTPVTDLGIGFYQGSQGGLYPGGSNARPSAHEAAGLSIANSIAPLDTMGHPDPAGRVVLISIGMSNCTQEFSAFVPKAQADPRRRANVRPIDCALGGQSSDVIRDPSAAYWDTVFTRLRGHGSSPAQAQAVWIKEAIKSPTGGFPVSAQSLMNDLGTIVRIIKQKLPNVRLCYLTSRIYAGYATGVSTLNPEPYAYESGFAVKWLIEGQIAGIDSLRFDPAKGPVEAPWLSWGPYLWADGLTPRNDGFTWACSSFMPDGTHPSATGRDIVADSLLAFFEMDDTTAPWFSTGTAGVHGLGGGDSPRLAVSPNPARASAWIDLAVQQGAWRVEILDQSGRRVRSLASRAAAGSRLRWDLADGSGRRVPSGAYWVRASRNGAAFSRRVVVVSR